MGEGLSCWAGYQRGKGGVCEGLDGQMVVVWEVQILHKHPLGMGIDGQGCVYDLGQKPSLD